MTRLKYTNYHMLYKQLKVGITKWDELTEKEKRELIRRYG